MPSGRVEDFCFRLFFSVLLIIFDFFICLSRAGTDEICFSSFKGSGLAHDKIFAGNTLRPKDARKILRKTAQWSDLAHTELSKVFSQMKQKLFFDINN